MLKRTFDILVSSAALLVLAVPFVITMLMLRLTGEGNVWYRQNRVGHQGRPFHALKFATMVSGSETMVDGGYTLRNDPRVLPLGRVLRKTKMNELPQILNILKGDMSFVGWRPVTPRSFAEYPDHVKEQIVQVSPGLTGIGSIIFRDEEAIVTEAVARGKDVMTCYREDIKPYKGELELWYKKNRNFRLDMKIIAATAWVVLFPRSKWHRSWFKGLPTPQSPLIRRCLSFESSDNTQPAHPSKSTIS